MENHYHPRLGKARHRQVTRTIVLAAIPVLCFAAPLPAQQASPDPQPPMVAPPQAIPDPEPPAAHVKHQARPEPQPPAAATAPGGSTSDTQFVPNGYSAQSYSEPEPPAAKTTTRDGKTHTSKTRRHHRPAPKHGPAEAPSH